MKKFLILLLLLSYCSTDQSGTEEVLEDTDTTTTTGVTMSDKVYDKQEIYCRS